MDEPKRAAGSGPDLPHAANLRRNRFSQPEAAYHITKCRHPALTIGLTHPGLAPIIVDSIRWHQTHGRAHLLGFVVMPDHVHWLFVLGQGQSLAGVMDRFCTFTWRQWAAGAAAGRPALWQAEYYERALREDERSWAAIEYIHNNPVRKGLCETPEEWPWSTANAAYREWSEQQYLV